MDENELKCISLKGDFKDRGKHILTPFGVTLCGFFTKDYDRERFSKIARGVDKADILQDYKIEREWEITCKQCLNIIEMAKKHRDSIN